MYAVVFFCGSWLVGSPHRSEGGLTANQSSAGARDPLWELACRGAASQRWRPYRPINHPQVHPIHGRSEPAREERPGNAGIQTAHVIVNDHRRSAARSKLARHKSFYDP